MSFFKSTQMRTFLPYFFTTGNNSCCLQTVQFLLHLWLQWYRHSRGYAQRIRLRSTPQHNSVFKHQMSPNVSSNSSTFRMKPMRLATLRLRRWFAFALTTTIRKWNNSLNFGMCYELPFALERSSYSQQCCRDLFQFRPRPHDIVGFFRHD